MHGQILGPVNQNVCATHLIHKESQNNNYGYRILPYMSKNLCKSLTLS